MQRSRTYVFLFLILLISASIFTGNAQESSTVSGLWVFEVGGPNGILLREDHSGAFISSDNSSEFVYELLDRYLLIPFPSAWVLEIGATTDDFLIFEDVVNGSLLVWINRELTTLPQADITAVDLQVNWYSPQSQIVYSFGSNGNVSTKRDFGQDSEPRYSDEINGTYGISSSQISLSVNENQTDLDAVWFNGNFIVFEGNPLIVWKKVEEEVPIQMENIFGIWKGVLGFSEYNPLDVSNNYYEFRLEGVATLSGHILQGVAEFEMIDNRIVGSHPMFVNGFDIVIKWLDKNILVMEEAAAGLIIVAQKVGTDLPDIEVTDNIVGTWVGSQEIFTVNSDGSTSSGTTIELVDNTLIVNGSTFEDVFRLDDYFLILENMSGDLTFYQVYSRSSE